MTDIKELQSIADYQVFNPAVSPAFSDCDALCTVLTCSCITNDNDWSSASQAGDFSFAFHLAFSDARVNVTIKAGLGHVRAVRGGL